MYHQPPQGGDCETADGQPNPLFIHDGLHGNGVHRAAKIARAICIECPVLIACQQWSGQFEDWASVTVAGWTARSLPSPPPWSPLAGVDRRGSTTTREERGLIRRVS